MNKLFCFLFHKKYWETSSPAFIYDTKRDKTYAVFNCSKCHCSFKINDKVLQMIVKFSDYCHRFLSRFCKHQWIQIGYDYKFREGVWGNYPIVTTYKYYKCCRCYKTKTKVE